MFWDKLAYGIMAILGVEAGQLTGRFVIRLGALAAALSVFFGLVTVSWNAVVNTFGVAANNALNAMADGDAQLAVQTFRCLIPASSGAAITLVMSTFLQAVVVIWLRRIVFWKLPGGA